MSPLLRGERAHALARSAGEEGGEVVGQRRLMSFADGCLVRLSELMPRAVVATLDSDFRVYRCNGRQVIPLLTP